MPVTVKNDALKNHLLAALSKEEFVRLEPNLTQVASY
jgi:hypothetical protein